MIRRHITFYGWVQGVGFRYRAHHAAVLYGCTGWVRNEWDGSVTMEVQGNPFAVKAMVERIKESRWIHIDSSNPRRIPAVPGESSFRVISTGY